MAEVYDFEDLILDGQLSDYDVHAAYININPLCSILSMPDTLVIINCGNKYIFKILCEKMKSYIMISNIEKNNIGIIVFDYHEDDVIVGESIKIKNTNVTCVDKYKVIIGCRTHFPMISWKEQIEKVFS